MYLALEVVSPQAATLGAARRRVVGPAGLTIGRAAGNDWIIPGLYISKQHARITFASGTFIVQGLGRNPIAIGSPDKVIPNHQPCPLQGGERLFIDEYEIRVSAVQGEAPQPARPVTDDPFGIVHASPPAGGSSFSSIPAAGSPLTGSSAAAPVPEPWESGLAGNLADTAELDPINALGGRAQPLNEPPPVDWQRASPLKDHFEPPALKSPAPAGIPVDWDESLAVPRAASPAPGPPSGIPPNWDRPTTAYARPTGGQPAPMRQAAPQQAAPPVPPPRIPQSGSAEPEAVRPVGAKSGERPAARPPPRSPASGSSPAAPVANPMAPPIRPAPAAAPRAAAAAVAQALPADFTELLRGAGLSERDVSPEVMRELGQVLRIVVQGVMEVLQARDEIKAQFRMPLTRVQAKENNPLKRCPNVEAALHTLLVERNPGYLPTAQAFEDAFGSIRGHQMAMLEGLRVAFESMLKSFDPKALEQDFEKSAGRGGLLGFGGRAKFWDLYVERFSRLGTDADDTFRRLFGDVFAEAYEQQLERLRRLRG